MLGSGYNIGMSHQLRSQGVLQPHYKTGAQLRSLLSICEHPLKAQRQVLNNRLINSFARDKNYICVQRKGIIFLKR